jgi:phosphopentomutase
MTRAFILVADSLGIGAAPDALVFGDANANTLGHIAQWRVDRGQRLRAPNLEGLGLGAAMHLACGHWPSGWSQRDGFIGGYVAAAERSRGKDTPSGHWEMAGVPVEFDWGYFPRQAQCFPADLIDGWVRDNALPGVLGECHASGTEIIAQLGDEHVVSGKPIVYTSADSVFQIAAHEDVIPPGRLIELCQDAFARVRELNIARVIARPFVGTSGAYQRTANRRDFAVAPPGTTLLDAAHAAGRETVAIGKIGDIFAHRGISRLLKGPDNMALFDQLMSTVHTAPEGALVFANFVDFDQNFGHRRDVAGYAHAIEAFDARLPEFIAQLMPGDIAVITADHGCDPTQTGSDHTREFVPQLFFGPAAPLGNLGQRQSFSDLGQTLAHHLNLAPLAHGQSLL